jgi:hypothetical protein
MVWNSCYLPHERPAGCNHWQMSGHGQFSPEDWLKLTYPLIQRCYLKHAPRMLSMAMLDDARVWHQPECSYTFVALLNAKWCI